MAKKRHSDRGSKGCISHPVSRAVGLWPVPWGQRSNPGPSTDTYSVGVGPAMSRTVGGACIVHQKASRSRKGISTRQEGGSSQELGLQGENQAAVEDVVWEENASGMLAGTHAGKPHQMWGGV